MVQPDEKTVNSVKQQTFISVISFDNDKHNFLYYMRGDSKLTIVSQWLSQL